jgi:hypothetical protein
MISRRYADRQLLQVLAARFADIPGLAKIGIVHTQIRHREASPHEVRTLQGLVRCYSSVIDYPSRCLAEA